MLSFFERRKSERIAVRTAARIMVPAGAPIDCIATDVCDGGARIHLRCADLPEVFLLHFSDSGKRRHCRVVWRHGSEIGVAFTDRIQANFGRRIAGAEGAAFRSPSPAFSAPHKP